MRTLVLLFLSIGCTIASANAKETLTIYTYDSFASEWGPGPNIKKAFEKECGCLLQFVPLEDGVAILNRLKLEGKYSRADLVLGMDDAMLAEARKSGLFADHKVDLAPITMPGGWQDPIFLPYDYGYLAFVYDTQKLKQAPTSFAELASRQDLRIIYEDPRTSTPGQGLLIWIKQTHKEEAAKLWQQLAKRTVTVTKGWSEAYGMFLKGEADMVLSYTTSPAYHRLAEQKNQYQAALFKEGHYRQVEVAARLASSKHPELASQFLHFILDEQFQSQIPTGNWMYPVTATPLPAGFDTQGQPSIVIKADEQQIARERKNWIKEWREAVSH